MPTHLPQLTDLLLATLLLESKPFATNQSLLGGRAFMDNDGETGAGVFWDNETYTQPIRHELMASRSNRFRPYQNKVELRFDTFIVHHPSKDILMKFL